MTVKERPWEHEEGPGMPFRGGPKRGLDLARRLDLERQHLALERLSRRLDLLPLAHAPRASKDGHAYDPGCDLGEQFQALSAKLGDEQAHSREVPTGMREAHHESALHGVAARPGHDDRDADASIPHPSTSRGMRAGRSLDHFVGP